MGKPAFLHTSLHFSGKVSYGSSDFVATTCMNGSVFTYLLPLKLEVQKLIGC